MLSMRVSRHDSERYSGGGVLMSSAGRRWRGLTAERRYVLDELYRDAAAVDAHHKTTHDQNYLARVPELADRTAWVLEGVDVS